MLQGFDDTASPWTLSVFGPAMLPQYLGYLSVFGHVVRVLPVQTSGLFPNWLFGLPMFTARWYSARDSLRIVVLSTPTMAPNMFVIWRSIVTRTWLGRMPLVTMTLVLFVPCLNPFFSADGERGGLRPVEVVGHVHRARERGGVGRTLLLGAFSAPAREVDREATQGDHRGEDDRRDDQDRAGLVFMASRREADLHQQFAAGSNRNTVLSSRLNDAPKSLVTKVCTAVTRMPISSGAVPHAFWFVARYEPLE